MKTLNWRRTDWNARNFVFSFGHEIFGELTLNNTWNAKAAFTDKNTQLTFTQKNFWGNEIIVTKDGKMIGEIDTGLLGTKTLKLETGEKFFISTSLMEQEVYWKSEKGETIITYRQALMSSMEKGSIFLHVALDNELEKLLISSGLFIRRLTRQRKVLSIVIMIPVFAAASQM